MSDSIMYLVKSKGGGMDGLDHTDKGGLILFASTNRGHAASKVGPWSKMEPVVVDLTQIARKVIAGLDPLECTAMRIVGHGILAEAHAKLRK